ncbi:MAG: pyridoxamine 5'-phosphate oxidase family protein [Roseburia sp.]|nr:pyridoxamine 5'-phosphate oxidase family protein [Roseburia sp.]MCM1098817.1 pyridoxamine 5'-phosphate oxidase family protein [Ruminococcus flavefaciens]
MFRKMRRFKNELPTEEVKNLLKTGRRGAFSVNGDGGYPYTVPVNFYYDEEENRIYLHSAKAGHKIDSLRASDQVCFTLWDDGYLESGDWAYHVSSCVVFGRAKLIEDGKVTEEKVRKLALKYYPTAEEAEEEIRRDVHRVQLIAIEIEHLSGKRVHER